MESSLDYHDSADLTMRMTKLELNISILKSKLEKCECRLARLEKKHTKPEDTKKLTTMINRGVSRSTLNTIEETI